MECLIPINFFLLCIAIVSCDQFNIIRFKKNSDQSLLICITDDTYSALTWNVDNNVKSSGKMLDTSCSDSTETLLIHKGKKINRRRVCDIDDRSYDCKFSFVDEASDWKLTWNSDVAMGPVFDTRWENFEIRTASYYQPVTVNKNHDESNLTFGFNGTLVVSIRSETNANFLICTTANFETDLCYWIDFNGLENFVGIKKCETGVDPKNIDCMQLRVGRKHYGLNIHEWRTYVITWNGSTKTIRLYNQDEEILSYTDTDSEEDDSIPYHVFFGNAHIESPAHYRFHQYDYVLTTRPGAQYDSYNYEIDPSVSKTICIEMMIGLCASCELHVRLVDPADDRELSKQVISSHKVEHNLPIWKYVRIATVNNNERRRFVQLKITTQLREGRGSQNHWAISDVQQCSPEGVVKRIEMLLKPEKSEISLWPNVTCQRLSYDPTHEQLIKSNMELSTLRGNERICPQSMVGPECSVDCRDGLQSTCRGVSICDENQCFCSPGHTVSDGCYSECTAENGKFGYDCRDTCHNCYGKSCNIHTGRCTGECIKYSEEYKLAPPFCNYAARFPEVQFTQFDSETVRVHFLKPDYDSQFETTYEFELQVNNNTLRRHKSRTGEDETEEPIHFTIFKELSPGMQLRARVIQHLQFDTIDGRESAHLKGDFSNYWIMCNRTSNFTTAIGKTDLVIDQKDLEESPSCQDKYSTMKVVSSERSSNGLRTDDAENVNETLPITIRDLTQEIADDAYISEINPSASHHRKLRTIPSVAENLSIKSSVKELKIDVVTSTTASFTWLPQGNPDDLIDGYSLTIKALFHEGCVNYTSEDLISVQSYNVTNSSRSYTVHDLIPYVGYEVTISAQSAQKDDGSSLMFTTNAAEIPTAVYQHLTFENGEIKWFTRVANCSTITGPIRATRLFFVGVSENVRDFTDQYDSTSNSFILGKTKKQDVHGCETYRVRVHPLRVVDGKHNESAYNEIIFTTDSRAPDYPTSINITDVGNGIVEVGWLHPPETGGPIREFMIECEMVSTSLLKKLWSFERDVISSYQIHKYHQSHTTRLVLLPSTRYRMKMRSVTQCADFILMGDSSNVAFETKSSIAWDKNQPSYTVNMTNNSIMLTLPNIANITEDCVIDIVLIGEDLCAEIPTLNKPLNSIIKLDKREKAWHINISPTVPSTISIGEYMGGGNITNCTLRAGSKYKIAIILSESNDRLNETEPFVWRSKPIIIDIPTRHEFWAIPLSLLIIIGLIMMILYLRRSRKNRKRRMRMMTRRTVQEPASKIEAFEAFDPIISAYQEPNELSHVVSNQEYYLAPIGAHLYEEISCKTLVQLDKFQEYVKSAIASGELQHQYSLMSPGRVQSWEDGLLSDHADGDEYEVEETVVVLEDPEDPYFECTNAHYIKGYKNDKAYIIMQGPQPRGVINFWQIIWQERVEIICTISDIREDKHMECDHSWPESCESMSYGNIFVENISHAQFADYTFGVFQVKRGEEIRVINHLHYTAWPEDKSPGYTQSIVAYMRKLIGIQSKSGPILVHCTVDIGRTATIVLLDICHRRAVVEGVFNVYHEVRELKKQRQKLMNTQQQYVFVHVALVDCLLAPDTSIKCNGSVLMRIGEHMNKLEELHKQMDQCAIRNQTLQSLMQPELKLSKKNIDKNRFTNSLPMTRLYIPRYPMSDEESSYISGVYVDNFRRRNSYIATQLPLPSTMTDFWRMIAALEVGLIIILQQPDIEDPTCCKFLPAPDEEIETLSFFGIRGKSILDREYFHRQKVVLIDKSTEPLSEQPVTILTLKGWDIGEDKAVPKSAALIDLYQMAEKVSQLDKPTVVLCHNGVTGCGLYLALSFLLERINLEHQCDVCSAIRAVRRSRFEFCQTRDQLEYLYKTASFYITHYGANINFD